MFGEFSISVKSGMTCDNGQILVDRPPFLRYLYNTFQTLHSYLFICWYFLSSIVIFWIVIGIYGDHLVNLVVCSVTCDFGQISRAPVMRDC